MKRLLNYILALVMASAIFTACVDDIKVGDAFLEKAPGVDVNIDTVFTKAEYARNFLWSAYGQLYCTMCFLTLITAIVVGVVLFRATILAA